MTVKILASQHQLDEAKDNIAKLPTCVWVYVKETVHSAWGGVKKGELVKRSPQFTTHFGMGFFEVEFGVRGAFLIYEDLSVTDPNEPPPPRRKKHYSTGP